MGQIRGFFFQIRFRTLWLSEPKCTESDLKKKSSDLSHLGPNWPTLSPNLVIQVYRCYSVLWKVLPEGKRWWKVNLDRHNIMSNTVSDKTKNCHFSSGFVFLLTTLTIGGAIQNSLCTSKRIIVNLILITKLYLRLCSALFQTIITKIITLTHLKQTPLSSFSLERELQNRRTSNNKYINIFP